jgi:hypothetical protein
MKMGETGKSRMMNIPYSSNPKGPKESKMYYKLNHILMTVNQKTQASESETGKCTVNFAQLRIFIFYTELSYTN